MAVYYCILCDAFKDADYDLPEPYQGGEICESCQYELDAQLDNQSTQQETTHNEQRL